MSFQAFKVRQKILGQEHNDTIKSMAMVGLAYKLRGRGGHWDMAEELEVQVMETSKKKLGVDHPSTLTSMANLACTWKGTSRQTQAIRLMEKCAQSQKRVLRANHPYNVLSYTASGTWKAELASIALPV
jgi:hypothetical protein